MSSEPGPVTSLEQMFCRLGCRQSLIQTNVKFCMIDRDTLARYNPGETRESTLTQTSLDQTSHRLDPRFARVVGAFGLSHIRISHIRIMYVGNYLPRGRRPRAKYFFF